MLARSRNRPNRKPRFPPTKGSGEYIRPLADDNCLRTLTRMNRILFAVICLTLVGCKSANYAFWDKFGYEKRDLLVSRVENAKEDQEKAKEQFKTTLQRFEELANFQGGELEAKYKKLNTEYERCAARAEDVSGRIKAAGSVGRDMFKEWKQELSQYQNPELRRNSEQKLNEAQANYE